jgi:AcrR family transcriptional regulator
LSRESIAASALAIIDRHGLRSLSARSLAAALGCEAMSLYHHVESMEAVLDGVVDRLLSGLLPLPGAEHEKGIGAQARAYLELARAHSEAFELVATRVWRGPNATAYGQHAVKTFAALGLPAREALGRSRILGAYLNGAGLALAAWRRFGGAMGPAAKLETVEADLHAGLELLLERLTRPDPPP